MINNRSRNISYFSNNHYEIKFYVELILLTIESRDNCENQDNPYSETCISEYYDTDSNGQRTGERWEYIFRSNSDSHSCTDVDGNFNHWMNFHDPIDYSSRTAECTGIFDILRTLFTTFIRY